MPDNNMSIDEVRDLLRFLMDRNDFMADPFSRAGKGAGWFNPEAFKPTRIEHQPFVEDELRGYMTFAGNTLEGAIARAILTDGPEGGTQTSILTTLQDAAAKGDPLTLAILPKTEQQGIGGIAGDASTLTPDWGQVTSRIDDMFNRYRDEQRELSQYKQEVRPDGSVVYYEEEPSKAAQRFTDLGLPTPDDAYGENLGRPSQFQSGLDPVLGSLQQQVAEEQRRLAQMEHQRDNIVEYDPRRGLAESMQTPQTAPSLRGGPSRGGVPLDPVVGFDGIDVDPGGPPRLPDIDLPLGMGNVVPSFEGGDDGGGQASSFLTGWLDKVIPNSVRGYQQTGNRVELARNATADQDSLVDDLLKRQTEAKKARAAEYQSQFGDDWLSAAGRQMAMRDSGRTPLSDVLNQLSVDAGMGSTFQPTMQRTSRGDFLAADPDNPRYAANRARAFNELIYGEPDRYTHEWWERQRG